MTRAGLLLCLLLLAGCEPGEESVRDLLAGPPAPLPVVVQVVTASNGSGNALWTDAFTQAVLTSAEGSLASTITFPLVSLTLVADDATYQRSQLDLLTQVCPTSRPGVLTVVISNPGTVTIGLSAQGTRAAPSSHPCVVLRASQGDGTAQNADLTARQGFLHELGHQLGLVHADIAAAQGELLHTDNYWMTKTGWVLTRDFALFLAPFLD
jgi:hypothetical protein